MNRDVERVARRQTLTIAIAAATLALVAIAPTHTREPAPQRVIVPVVVIHSPRLPHWVIETAQ